MKLLLEAGKNPTCIGGASGTPLHFLASKYWSGWREKATLLLGMDVNALDMYGRTLMGVAEREFYGKKEERHEPSLK